MTYLADINVLVALVVIGHVHHPAALRWIDHSGGEVAVCRVAQMGFLRLLTNARVMGENVESAAKAWDIFAAMFEDPRFVFHPEPAGLEAAWRSASRHPHSGPNFWTDAYLAAFAQAAGIGIVTFDAALRQHRGVRVVALP